MKGARLGLLTGPVGVGKTTVAERVVGLARRQDMICGGLLAPTMVNRCGQKVGIWGVDVRTGERRILARTERDLGGPEVGPYSFDTGALDWALTALERSLGACDLLIVDEIGKLELWKGIGLAPILPRLTSAEAGTTLILVRDFLLADLQAHLEPAQQVIFETSEENREALAARIFGTLIPNAKASGKSNQEEQKTWQT
jgi:nucleoside-triphosphatase THEP1